MAEHIDDNRERFIKDAVQQFVDAQIEGQQPDLDEFVKKYPEFEHQIRQMIQNVHKIDALFASLTHAEESGSEAADESGSLVGQKLGGFEIREMIGRGGMGVVYLAYDTRLDRSVAIKSMPPELMDSATTRTRFQREAKLLASLNHPNIAVIHDIIEQDEGAGYLVLEYVPGETLSERIAREPLKLDEALSISQQTAEAVSAAHKKGIVHRDLKPGNIKITPDGRIKVLDFGLAKAPAKQVKKGEITETQPGRVIGTPAYMSPEQARGKETDHRTDIWSFGCIMYQMLTAHLPFEGETATDTLAHIIERQPDWQALPQETPANIRVLLRRCLEKDPRCRLRHIGDAGIEIGETLSKPATIEVTMPTKLRRMAMIIGAVVIGIILSGIALKYIPQKGIQPSSKEIRLVVLPFENLGSVEDEYFAAGITDQITSYLAPIRGLFVLSPRTAAQYEKGKKNARQMGKELGVDYILEGTVQRERPSDQTSPVRVMPRLVRASQDRLVLAPIYRIYNENLDELYQVQSDMAEQVAQVFGITLLEPERRELQYRPTENKEAYEYYLLGNNSYNRSFLESDSRVALRMYEKAVELDNNFALAYARLSRIHLRIFWFHYDPSEEREERLALAKQAVDKAFQLNPGLPETNVALGFYHYWGHLDYERALEQFAIARKSQPNDSSLLSGIGWVQRRQGKFEQALANLKRACELNPLSALLMEQVGETFLLLRKYPEAERYFDRSILRDPYVSVPYHFKAELYLRREGSTNKARTVLEKALENIKSTENSFINLLVTLDVYDRKYPEALERLSLKSEDTDSHVFYFIPIALRYARIYRYMKKKEPAEKYYDEAKSILESKVMEDPNDARYRSSLGVAYAGLGRKEDAIREGKKGVELLPVTKDAWGGLDRVEALANIYVMVGEFDAAIDQLEFLLSRPGELSIPLLRLDPAWAPLRDHPRFKKLVEPDK